jgi:hypothetical protein
MKRVAGPQPHFQLSADKWLTIGGVSQGAAAPRLSVQTHSAPRRWLAEDSRCIYSGMKQATVIQVDPDILSGAPVFAGTRVPVQTLLEAHDCVSQVPPVHRAAHVLA